MIRTLFVTSAVVAITLLTGCTASLPPISAAGAASAASSRVPPPHDVVEALFYAFRDGELAIFNVTYETLPKLRKAVSIPYVHLHGACSDPSGRVFVTQSGTSGSGAVIEFKHGGTSAVATLSDSGMAVACAYDRRFEGPYVVSAGYTPNDAQQLMIKRPGPLCWP